MILRFKNRADGMNFCKAIAKAAYDSLDSGSDKAISDEDFQAAYEDAIIGLSTRFDISIPIISDFVQNRVLGLQIHYLQIGRKPTIEEVYSRVEESVNHLYDSI